LPVTAEIVTVEFYGVPRLRAGCAELAVSPGSATAVLAEVAARCPGLSDLLTGEGRLSPHYLLSVDGQVFVADLADQLSSGSHLLLLSADAGG
jgi:molybdopterin converting factor small subunit